MERSWLFQAATAEDLDWLAPRCEMLRYRRGARIVTRGTPMQRLFVVAQGDVKGTLPSVEGDGEFVIGLLRPGHVFGEVSMLENTAAFGNALAMTDAYLLAIPRADMLAVMERRPGLRLRLLGLLADKLRTALDLNLSLRFLDIPTRFYQRLLTLARFESSREGDGLRIVHGLSQQELADSIGASREALNKVIGEWKREGLIEWGRGYVVVRDPMELSSRMPAFLRQEGGDGASAWPGFAPWPGYSSLMPGHDAAPQDAASSWNR